MEHETFNVITYEKPETNNIEWKHWSEGLVMMITKGNKTIILDSEEIKKLVKTLPRTFGGSY